ncbi:hypothetical protein XELAEV_18046311mg [Xenopus laevis]|uniref:DEP domain-containing protein n=1 Tax=Xenopus laevis TaxID=8355 RepID=A0A974BT41_XENLA|nr:hypothetical protein XELAEV_18046311mg [Xenopus laevis]
MVPARRVPQGFPCTEPGMETLSRSQGERAGENQRRAEIGLAGEQLRLRLHNAKLIKDRCQDTRTYPNCLVGKELVDWLVEHSEAPDRATAVSIIQRLMDYNVVHHVCDEHVAFKDARLLYRFRNDDGTLSPSKQVKICVRGHRLYEMITSQEGSILQVREQGSERYRRTFHGRQILDWLLDHGEVSSREEGVKLCRELLEYGIIQHVSGHQHFSDSEMLFQFTINFQRRRKLIEVLSEPDPFMDPKQESPDSPFCLRKLSSDLPPNSFVCVQHNEPKIVPAPRRCGYHSPGSGSSYTYLSPSVPLMTPPSVLKKPVTVEELLSPGAPYTKKILNIMGDDVGWGFVIRGSGPCHIQAVDPGGPAAAAGMKVCQFIYAVNGNCCLRYDCQTINRLIVAGPRALILEVLEPFS